MQQPTIKTTDKASEAGTIDLGTASVETKGGGAYIQPDTNQPSRQAFGIQDD